MAYIGPPPSQKLATPTSQYFSGNGSATAFTLNRPVNVAEDLNVFVNNVPQEPGSGKSYTATGTTLTFDAAPSSGTNNVYVVYRGLAEPTTRLEHPSGQSLAATTGTFSGTVTAAGLTTTGDINFGDSDKAIFGAGSDLQIYHNGSNSFIDEAGTGDLYIRSNSGVNINKYTGETMIYAVPDGAVNLYHNNAAKFATTATGVDVTGNVGIGTASDTNENNIQIINNSVTAFVGVEGSSGNRFIGSATNNAFFGTTGADGLEFATNNNVRMKIDSSGALKLLALPSGAGNADLRVSTTDGTMSFDTSSRLVKENIVDCPYGLAEVIQLQPRKYLRTDDQVQEVGFIAEEVSEILPEFVPMMKRSVFTKKDEDTDLVAGSVNYSKLTAVLTKAIQEQQATIKALEARITALESK